MNKKLHFILFPILGLMLSFPLFFSNEELEKALSEPLIRLDISLSRDLLSQLSAEELISMREVGKKLAHQSFALPEKALKRFEHFPDGDVYDTESRMQHYFHRHRPNEVGHIHLFAYPELENEKTFTQMVAVAVDEAGNPTALFTTNAWVTGETWLSLDEIDAILQNVVSGAKEPYFQNLLCFFQPQIKYLHQQREELFRKYGEGFTEKKAYEVLAEFPISVSDQLALIEDLLAPVQGGCNSFTKNTNFWYK